jgi:flagellar basal body-associated protein FliL
MSGLRLKSYGGFIYCTTLHFPNKKRKERIQNKSSLFKNRIIRLTSEKTAAGKEAAA